MIASHTSGTNLDIDCLEILKVYMGLVNDSPLARNRMETASLIEAGIVSLNLVSHFEIFPPNIWRSSSKSLGVILVKLLNPIPSSSFNFSKRLSPTLTPTPAKKFRLHQRFRFPFFTSLNNKEVLQTLIAQRATSLVIAQTARQKLSLVRNYVWTRDNVYVQSRDSVSKQSLDSRDTLSATLYPSVDWA